MRLQCGYVGGMREVPHLHASHILPKNTKHLVSMQNFAGMLEYLVPWVCVRPDGIEGYCSTVFSIKTLPLLVDDGGHVKSIEKYVAGIEVLRSDRHVFDYLLEVVKWDLQYRGFRDDRMASFEFMQEPRGCCINMCLLAQMTTRMKCRDRVGIF